MANIPQIKKEDTDWLVREKMNSALSSIGQTDIPGLVEGLNGIADNLAIINASDELEAKLSMVQLPNTFSFYGTDRDAFVKWDHGEICLSGAQSFSSVDHREKIIVQSPAEGDKYYSVDGRVSSVSDGGIPISIGDTLWSLIPVKSDLSNKTGTREVYFRLTSANDSKVDVKDWIRIGVYQNIDSSRSFITSSGQSIGLEFTELQRDWENHGDGKAEFKVIVINHVLHLHGAIKFNSSGDFDKLAAILPEYIDLKSDIDFYVHDDTGTVRHVYIKQSGEIYINDVPNDIKWVSLSGVSIPLIGG